MTQPGDAVIVESPTFYAALQSLERNHLHAIEVATHPREGIDLQALEAAILRHRPRACWLMTNFQNPLGSLMPDDKKEALVRLLAQHDVALIEDDVYGELYFGENRPRPAKAFDRDGIVMHCSSFSKTLAPGYRVGWVAAGRYTRQIMRNKLTTSLATAAPTQAAIAAYLEKGGFDRHLRQFRQALAQQQGELLQAIARYFPKGTRATRPAGGYFVWVELPPHIDTLKLHRAALGHGIEYRAGPAVLSLRRVRQFPPPEWRTSLEPGNGARHGDAGQAAGGRLTGGQRSALSGGFEFAAQGGRVWPQRQHQRALAVNRAPIAAHHPGMLALRHDDTAAANGGQAAAEGFGPGIRRGQRQVQLPVVVRHAVGPASARKPFLKVVRAIVVRDHRHRMAIRPHPAPVAGDARGRQAVVAELHPAQVLGIEDDAAAFLAGAMFRVVEHSLVGLVR